MNSQNKKTLGDIGINNVTTPALSSDVLDKPEYPSKLAGILQRVPPLIRPPRPGTRWLRAAIMTYTKLR